MSSALKGVITGPYLRAAYRATDTTAGRRRAEQIQASFHTCPIPAAARLGRTLRPWREAFLASFERVARTTAAPRPTTAPSSCTAASPAAAATVRATAYACSLPPAT